MILIIYIFVTIIKWTHSKTRHQLRDFTAQRSCRRPTQRLTLHNLLVVVGGGGGGRGLCLKPTLRGFRGSISVQVVYHHRWMLYWPSHGAIMFAPNGISPQMRCCCCVRPGRVYVLDGHLARATRIMLPARRPFVPWVIIRATCVQSPCINKWALAAEPLPSSLVSTQAYISRFGIVFTTAQTQSHQNIYVAPRGQWDCAI